MKFYRDVFDGKPFMCQVVQLLPLRKDGKPRAKPYVEFEVPAYPTLDQRPDNSAVLSEGAGQRSVWLAVRRTPRP